MADKSNVLVFKSKNFITEPVRAVFPHVNEPDKYGSFTISADVLNSPEFRATLEQQAEETLKAAHQKLNVDKLPTNVMFKDGVYEGEPNCRVTFKMASTRKVKGRDVNQSPRLVDAQRQPMSEVVWGGSLVKIAYFIQYTIMPTGTYLSLKLNAVQVIHHVGPGGEVAIDELFDEEEGFSTTVEEQEETPVPPDEAGVEGANSDAKDW